MNNQIEDVLTKMLYTKIRSRRNKINSDPILMDWIKNHCNQMLLTIPNQENMLELQIYSALHPTEELICKNGNLLSFDLKRKKLHCLKTCGCFRNAAREKQKTTLLTKYGVENPFASEEIKEKIKNTNLKKYGTPYPNQNETVRNKCKKTCQDKYGVDNPAKLPNVQERIASTCLERYGIQNPQKLPEIKEITRQTILNRYGFSNPMQVDFLKAKAKETNIKRFGVENPFASEEIKEKIKNTNLKKYGVTSYQQRNFSSSAMEILLSRDEFEKMLLTHGQFEMSEKLKVSISTIYKTHNKLGLNIIQQFSSGAEAEICHWLEQQGIRVEKHNRTICTPNELDIFIPTKNLAIEFNGLYWHSTEKIADKNYHLIKTKKCREHQIQLLHIFEDEWRDHKEICKSIIQNHLGLSKTIIFARKCQVIELSNKECKQFLNSNHLQGYVPATKNIGLLYNNDLVAVMTFKKPRYNKNIEWELLRLRSLSESQILGGTKKMWNHFQTTVNPISVISYCDRRWFSGNIYSSLGFIKKQDAKPTYWYTNFINRFHRSRYTKKLAVLEAIKITDISKSELDTYTENQITRDILGLSRIWDCGQDSWIWAK